MRRAVPAILVVVLSAAAAASAAEETSLATRVESLGLFKNGLAVVRRTAEVEAPGVYRVEDVPTPVHGTLWVESDAKVTVRVTRRVVEVPVEQSRGGDFQQDLAGREVVVHFAERGIPPAAGTVLEMEPPRGSAAFSRQYEQPQFGYWHYGRWHQTAPSAGMLLLKTDDGLCYVERSRIAMIQAKGAVTKVKQRKPVLLLDVGPIKDKPATVAVTYLAKGIAWAPSYRVDISDAKTLSIRQSAVIKNELGPIADAEVRLISGFPSVQFSHVTSPLSLETSWSSFFQQLNQRFQPGHASMRNMVVQQAVRLNAAAPDSIDFSAAPSGDGVDLHYQPIGRHTLDEGDSLSLETGSGKADYDRIVEWIIPDTRQSDGRYVQEHQIDNDPERYQDALWDAVRFRNPLPFPMTTAPAMVTDGERFNGQRMSFWVNTGERTTLHVTKALSVRARHAEREVPDGRSIVHVGSRAYRKTACQGTVTANNHRKEEVTLVIRRRFSGELISAEGDPKCSLREEGAWSVNPRNELVWIVALGAGEEKAFSYRYSVLVRN